MDVKPQIIDGRTMVPAAYVAENLGATVGWVEETQTVTITSKQVAASNVTEPAEQVTEKPITDTPGIKVPSQALKTQDAYKIGEWVEFENTKIKIHDAHETDNMDGFEAPEGEAYYVIEFSIITNVQPRSGRTHPPYEFIYNLYTVDGINYSAIVSTGNDPKIYLGEETECVLYMPIEQGETIDYVLVSDGEGNTANVYVD
jgi:hypothetical protein